jgi:hypothetical protein
MKQTLEESLIIPEVTTTNQNLNNDNLSESHMTEHTIEVAFINEKLAEINTRFDILIKGMNEKDQVNDDTSIAFSETNFGETCVHNSLISIQKIKNGEISNHLPFTRDSFDSSLFVDFNKETSNKEIIFDYLKKVKANTDLLELPDISKPVVSEILKYIYDINIHFKKFVDTGMIPFYINDNDTINIKSFSNVFMYVSQIYKDLSLCSLSNILIVNLTMDQLFPGFSLFKECEIENLQTKYVEKNLEINLEAEKEIINIEKDLNNNISSITKFTMKAKETIINFYATNKNSIFIGGTLTSIGLFFYKNPQFAMELYNIVISTIYKSNALNEIKEIASASSTDIITNTKGPTSNNQFSNVPGVLSNPSSLTLFKYITIYDKKVTILKPIFKELLNISKDDK